MTKLLSAMLVDASERKKMEKEVVQKKKIEVLLQIMESKEQEKFDNFLKIIKEVYPAFSQGKGMNMINIRTYKE